MRPDQLAFSQRIDAAFAGGVARVLGQAPTGFGKGVVIAERVRCAAQRSQRILILAHRVEIVEQLANALDAAGVSFGRIVPRAPSTVHLVQLASVAAIARRLDAWRDRFDLVIVDECHHAVAGSWAAVLASQTGGRILGFTATPERLDGRGLGEIFDEMVVGPATAELIQGGWLANFVVYEPARPPDLSGARIRGGDYAVEDVRQAVGDVVIGAAASEYRRLCPATSAIAFCVDVAHSKAVAERFAAVGLRAAHIDGETSAAERRAAIAALGGRGLDVLCNCGLVSEGLDVPAIGAVLMLRPTASLALHLQMVGRALRPARGKERAVILDFAGNVARHGLPDAPRMWSLDARPRRQRVKSSAPHLRKCLGCSALNGPAAHECVACGADLHTPAERREIELRLQENRRRETIEKLRRLPRWHQVRWAGADERRLRLIAEMNGFRPGWCFHQRQRALAQSEGGP